MSLIYSYNFGFQVIENNPKNSILNEHQDPIETQSL